MPVSSSHTNARLLASNSTGKVIDFIKKEMKDGFPEDIGKRKEAEVDKMLHAHYDTIDHLIAAKEKDIMTV